MIHFVQVMTHVNNNIQLYVASHGLMGTVIWHVRREGMSLDLFWHVSIILSQGVEPVSAGGDNAIHQHNYRYPLIIRV